MTFKIVIVALWICFYSYWLISALSAKKAVRTARWKGLGLRLLLVAIALMLSPSPLVRQILLVQPSSMVLKLAGTALCGAGMAFAVWARLNLGKNWGTPMSLKERHELVTTGPYRFVRHPIYTGILLALVGTAFVVGLIWLLVLAVACPYFVYSARVEEGLMMQQFPDTYPAYKSKTNALIPFVW